MFCFQILFVSLQHRLLAYKGRWVGDAFMEETFSNVCRCESWTSQTQPLQQTDDNEASA